jgi:hypothetical protein
MHLDLTNGTSPLDASLVTTPFYSGDLKTSIPSESIILIDFLCMLLCLGECNTLGDMKMHIIEY